MPPVTAFQRGGKGLQTCWRSDPPAPRAASGGGPGAQEREKEQGRRRAGRAADAQASSSEGDKAPQELLSGCSLVEGSARAAGSRQDGSHCALGSAGLPGCKHLEEHCVLTSPNSRASTWPSARQSTAPSRSRRWALRAGRGSRWPFLRLASLREFSARSGRVFLRRAAGIKLFSGRSSAKSLSLLPGLETLRPT